MKKCGFTLIELLVVIAIIAILSVIIVPSVITVNKNVNERLYQEKKQSIISAAELYASNNPDIFNGAESVYVYVYQLIDADYLKVDSKFGDASCTAGAGENISKGCVINPAPNDANDVILNNRKVLLTKKSVGIVGKFEDGSSEEIIVDSDTLVNAVCNRFKNGVFKGVSHLDPVSGAPVECTCVESGGNFVDLSGGAEACLIVSDSESGNVNNWLKYGSSEANWRVLGIYKVDGVLYPKMITANVID